MDSVDFSAIPVKTPASRTVKTMALTDKDVAHIAKLARIRLAPQEMGHYTRQINDILKWIEQLQQVNTDSVAPLASISDQLLPWREDKVTDGNKQEAILKNAPMQQYGCFAVPKVIE
ncbi:MAG: Asp-tRNA(Asn)/Glu-tRNA(Gln) amidotransferase subunit GatC [Alphaproteobacteria bacterium]